MRPIGTLGKDERNRGEVSASPLHIVAAPDSYRKMLPLMYVTAGIRSVRSPRKKCPPHVLPPRFLRGPVGRSEKPGGITARSLALPARRAAAPVGCSLSPRAPPDLNLRAAALRAAALRALRAWRGGAAIKLGGLVAAPPLPPLWLSVGGWWSVPPLAVGGCLRSAVCPSREIGRAHV